MKLDAPGFRRPSVLTTAVVAGSAALAVGTAFWVKRRARAAERATPPIGRFVEVDGVRLHYVERGDGPPVVLLHGNTVLLQDFIASGLLDALAERHRVIAFDRPGYGFSERPRGRLWTPAAQAAVLEQAFRALGIESPVVLGHSWGTLVALALALDFPTKVRGLVLASGYYYPTPRLDVALTAPVALPVLGDVLRYTVSPIMGRLSLKGVAKAMFSPCALPSRFFEVLSRELMLRPGQIAANAQDAAFMIPAAASFAARYDELRLPITVIAGEQDRIVDIQAHSARFQEAVPHSTLISVGDAGHMVHYAAPDRVVAAIDRLSTMSLGSPVREAA